MLRIATFETIIDRISTLYSVWKGIEWLLGPPLVGVVMQTVTAVLGASPLTTIAYGLAAGILAALASIAYLLAKSPDERKELLRVLDMLRKRQEVGDSAIELRRVASIWHGNDGTADSNEELLWNYKFRLLKQAVDSGRVRGTPLGPTGKASLQTKGNIEDLITYFRWGRS